MIEQEKDWEVRRLLNQAVLIINQQRLSLSVVPAIHLVQI